MSVVMHPPSSSSVVGTPTWRRRSHRVLQSIAVVGGIPLGLLALRGPGVWPWVRGALVVAALFEVTRWLGRDEPGVRGTAALSAGTGGVVVGSAFGAGHVLKSGASPVAVAGLIVLVTGVALVASGAWLLIRRARPWRRLWALPTAAVLILFVWVPVSLALYATNVPSTTLGADSPADRGLAYVDVEVMTDDAVVLAGWYVPSRNGAAVVLLHGSGSTRSNVLDHAVVLAGHGYGVLLVDTRGHGQSGGRPLDFGWYGELDVKAAVTSLVKQAEVDPDRIGVIGVSMGGEQALTAAAADERIRVVVAEGVTGRVVADNAWLPDHPGRWINYAMDWIQYGIVGLISGARPPIPLTDAVAAIAPRPVLLIAAGAVPDEGRAGRHYAAVAPASVDLWEVPGSGHGRGLTTAPEEWEARVIAVLDAAL
jgi:uncharacterized protein